VPGGWRVRRRFRRGRSARARQRDRKCPAIVPSNEDADLDHDGDERRCHSVGAVQTDDFDFFACLNHNYREFLFGFEDWVHTIAAAGSVDAYKSKFTTGESLSIWQSLSFGSNYKAAYCMSVCPAGDDVIGPYQHDRIKWRNEIVEPFKTKNEPIYVASGSRAERVALRNPNKRVRYIDYRINVSTPANFALGIKHRFDTRRAVGAGVTVRFDFPGGGSITAQVTDGRLTVAAPGELGPPNATVRFTCADYITLLHPTATALDVTSSRFDLIGDPAALGALLATFD
jgi:hypothetical protein